ncbi:DUF5345 family protein [Paenibacillus sp. R14(2021)]|uniref:DUF5345 family protein n=1 Tax=Paenibacillus sp. R14(2021) TaxID=2859228 RepID=UPI001C6165DF|nr:DUF5345 family protein [Paenibacillus sp. R14(2021)]
MKKQRRQGTMNAAEEAAANSAKRDEELELERTFGDLLWGHVEKWDHAIEPQVPSVEALSQLVRERKGQLRSRMQSERLVFGLISLVLLSGLLLVWQCSILLFAVLQSVVFAAAAGFLVLASTLGRKERLRR